MKMKGIRVKLVSLLMNLHEENPVIRTFVRKAKWISISNSQDMSETFNDHFAAIGPKLP